MHLRLSRLCIVVTLAAGCGRGSAGTPGPIDLGVPDLASAHVTLAADGDRVAAAWAATGTKGTDIYAAVSLDGARTFGRTVRVNDIDGDASVSGEQPPRILVKGSDVDVLWVSKRAGVAGIRAAASTDGGVTFAPARSITPAGLTGARGWESATIASDGTVHAVWLDGRNSTPSTSGAPHHHGDMRQDIYHAMWKGGAPSVETPVASNVCFCCKTAVVTRGSDVFVAWRHLFPGGVRDIAIARSADGGRTFQDPVRVSEDNWKIDACPDDGPAMAVDSAGVLHLTWPTLVTDPDGPRMAIFESTSRDGGATFSPRARVDAVRGGAAHPRIAVDTRGGGAVVWDELAQGARRVLIRRAGDGGAVALSTGRIASYPAVVAVGDTFVVAWTDQSESGSVIRAVRAGPASGLESR